MMDRMVRPFIVRGKQRAKEMTRPTTPNTIEQVPCSAVRRHALVCEGPPVLADNMRVHTDCVHSHGKGEDMTAHDEEDQEDQPSPEKLTAERAHEDLARICEALDMRVSPLELADDIATVGRQETENDQENNSSLWFRQYYIGPGLMLKLTGLDPGWLQRRARTRCQAI
jgi:hypothetical protein